MMLNVQRVTKYEYILTRGVTYPNNSYPASQVYVAKVPVAKDSSDNDTLAFIGTAGCPHFNPAFKKITQFNYSDVLKMALDEDKLGAVVVLTFIFNV